MSEVRREKTLVSQLDIGMFVCELDRPWLGTPFLLEGLLIEDKAQVETLTGLCEFVYIDRTFSVGQHYLAPPKLDVATKYNTPPANSNSASSNAKSIKGNNESDKFSFFEILKEIKASNQNSSLSAQHNDAVVFNVSYAVHPEKRDSINKHSNSSTSSLASQIKTDFSNFVSSLKYWGDKQKKSRLNTALSEEYVDIKKSDDFNTAVIEERAPVEEEIAIIYPAYEKTKIATQAFFEAIAHDQQIDLSKVDDALGDMVESIERNPDALIWLAKLKQTDDYSYNHALNVSITLMALASFMSLPKKQIKDLGLSGLLQDIGKVKIPNKLLKKEERLTEAEFEILKKHVDYALELLEVTDNISGTVILTVSQHHERVDGSGYPYQLTGKQISLTGQMAGLVDTYCALTSSKPYAKSVYNQIALEQIHTLRDVKFSGLLIDQLVQFLGIYPVSSLVELNSGEVGVVIQQNTVRRLQPRVMILLNPDKSKNEYPATINLINSPLTPKGEPYQIVKGLAPDSYGLNINNYFG